MMQTHQVAEGRHYRSGRQLPDVSYRSAMFWSSLARSLPTTAARAGFPMVAFSVLAALGCAARQPPVLEPLRLLEDRTPVVLIPGVTGSQLRDRETGKVVWGTASRFFSPRDGGYDLALPIGGAAPDRLEAFAPIVELKLLGIWKFDIYGSLLRLMEANGYRLGDLADPQPGDSFFFFPYDWRHGSSDAAGELAARLENLRRVRGDEVLRVSFLCHSNAARIARYFVQVRRRVTRRRCGGNGESSARRASRQADSDRDSQRWCACDVRRASSRSQVRPADRAQDTARGDIHDVVRLRSAAFLP